ncbi:MAG: glycine-rich domain-containing protein [Planctomycetota bacterium]
MDQAWHLHLTYTRSYWERFCHPILGRPLHHEPTAGGAAEGHKFEDWYAKTLDSYQRLFNEIPPADIWPAPKKRFARSNDWKWYNAGQHWLLPRPSTAMLSMLAAALLLLSLSGCISLLAAAPPNNDFQKVLKTLSGFSWATITAFCLHAALTLTVVIRVFRKTNQLRDEAGEVAPPEETPQAAHALSSLAVEDVAVLAGGARRLATLSLLRLQSLGCVQMSKHRRFLPRTLEPVPGCSLPTEEVDRVVLTKVREKKNMWLLVQALKPQYDAAVSRLQRAGLRYPSRIRCRGLLLLAFLPLLLWLPLAVGFLRDPACVIPLMYSMFAAIFCVVVNFRPTRITPSGRWVLRQKRAETLRSGEPMDGSEAASHSVPVLEPVMLNIALAGVAFAMTQPALKDSAELLGKALPDPPGKANSGCGSTGADVAGGCGGGCSSSGCGGDASGCGASGCGASGCGASGCGGGGCGG